MINVVVSGCNGAMGRVLTKAIEEMEDITIVAGIDKNINSYKNTYPVYKSPLLVKEECDVIIDFSKPSNLSGLLEYSVNNNIALVIATTGFSEEEENKIKEASKFTRIFKSLENTNDERAREAEKEKAEKIETAKQHKAIDDNVDNTAVTLNDNQSDDSNN